MSNSPQPRRVLLTGGGGMLGQAICRAASGRSDLVVIAPRRSEFDLTGRDAVREMFAVSRPDVVIHAAAKVGGIQANIAEPYAFLNDNIFMNAHVIEEAARTGIESLVFIGSSCMYPKDLARPLREVDILTAPLEGTNEGYALSKIVGAKACEYLSRERGLNFKTIIPCNLYGPGDTFDSQKSHLVAAVIKKITDAVSDGRREIDIWGSGLARREFLYVDDLAVFILRLIPDLNLIPQYLNIGALEDHSVNDYYEAAASVLGWRGGFVHDLSKPEGMLQKLMDSRQAVALGWAPRTALNAGIAKAAAAYLEKLDVTAAPGH